MKKRLLNSIENRRLKKEVRSSSYETVSFLALELGERTPARYENLDSARKYINDRFRRYGYTPVEETYSVDEKSVANISAEIPGKEKPEEIILVGAHYDTVENTAGADDNASGIAGLLELSRLAAGTVFKRTVRFTAFTLEEPPYFSTEEMGSMVHAAGCRERGEDIRLMICLEMIGYGGKNIRQNFPQGLDSGRYPKNGDFLSVVTLPSSSEYALLFKKVYNNRAANKIYDLIAPASVPGVSHSDHLSFIHYGYPSVMITDTGFYRNDNYHGSEDTLDTLNFSFLADNIINTFNALTVLAERENF
jgi:Zn-dependent M28 family amino/carboxypeptidase